MSPKPASKSSKPGDANPEPTPPAQIGFEAALDEIEMIIEKIESGEIGLEASVAAYERGAALVQRCRELLGKAEQRVEQIGLDLDPKES